MYITDQTAISFIRYFAFVALFVPIDCCRVEECAQWFQKTREYENLTPTDSERYCQVLQTYLKCMNDTMRFCHGNLRFHSSELVMRRHWNEFNCTKYNKDVGGDMEVVDNTCYFNPPSSHGKMKYCSLFGDPHLIRFDGIAETCSEEGARPLVDNRYFLIQVTNKNVRGEPLTTTVNKVTILIRRHNCTSSLQYEASSDEQDLPRGFIDGSTYQKRGNSKNSVELLWQQDNYVEIALHYIHTSIHIRRQGPYLSVSVRSPTNVLETGGKESKEMCWMGCRKAALIDIERALIQPKEFGKCYARRIHVPSKIAEDRCRDIGTTDNFFDACVFDLMFTGDDYLVSLAHCAQSDFRRLSPHHLVSKLLRHRNHLSLSPSTPSSFTSCISASASSLSLSLLAILPTIVLFRYL